MSAQAMDLIWIGQSQERRDRAPRTVAEFNRGVRTASSIGGSPARPYTVQPMMEGNPPGRFPDQQFHGVSLFGDRGKMLQTAQGTGLARDAHVLANATIRPHIVGCCKFAELRPTA
jgi:hypothetical protein